MLIISSALLRSGRDISFARIFASSCWSDRAGNFAVGGCIQLDESQQDWVYGLGAVVFGYDVDCHEDLEPMLCFYARSKACTVPSVSLVVCYQGLLYLCSIQPQVVHDDTLGLGTVSVGDPRKPLWHLR